MKKRAIKNTKHRIAKARRIVRRTGDDRAESTNKQFIETDRHLAKGRIRLELAPKDKEKYEHIHNNNSVLTSH